MTRDEEASLLPLALRAAAKASEAIMAIYQSAEDIGIRQKQDETPVTRADMASNAAIAAELEPSGIAILSEETEHEPFDTRSQRRLLWVVDPLDGTKEFIKRNDMFSVCIALVEDHRAVMGVIALPTEGKVYFTRSGSAWRGTLLPEGTMSDEVRLPVAFGPVPHIVLGSVSHPNAATQRALDALRSQPGWTDTALVGVGSSIKQCMVAEGSAALYPRTGTTMEWDTAAGQAIIEAAGGVMLVADDGEQPMSYNRAELRNPDFVAAAPTVDRSIVKVAIEALKG